MTPGRRGAVHVATRRAVAAAAVVLLVGGWAGGAASAASNLTVTRSDGSNAAASSTTGDTCFTVVGSVPSSLTPKRTQMTIVDPSGTSHSAGGATSSAAGAKQITFRFGTRTLSWDDSCSSGGSVAPNGTYTARLSGGVTSSLSFDLAVPPPAPSGFAAAVDGTVAHFSWQRNAEEPDFIGYEVADSAGRSVTGLLRPGDVCTTTACSVTVDFGPSAAGKSMRFAAQAVRSNGAGGQAVSASSPPKTVRFPVPRGATQAAASSRGGTGTSGPARHHRKLSGKHPAAELRSYLPASSAGRAPDLPSVITEVKPLPEGTYKPRLAYPDRASRPAAGPDGRAGAGRTVAEVFSERPLWRAVAGAALLFLLAAHLRAWLARLDASDS